MDYTIIISAITSVGLISSMILNWVQYRNSKTGTSLNNYEKQLEILEKLQTVKDNSYEQALRNKDLEIEGLRRDISDLRIQLEANTARISVLQNAVNKLIGDGCKRERCQQRAPYSTEEIGSVLGFMDEHAG